MIAEDSQEVVHQAERIYEERLKGSLEATHLGSFLAIEPVSGDYFLGRNLSEAVGAAREAHPDRLSYVLRVGQQTAVHIGVCAT
jgi:hypothetical protein